MCRCLWGRKHSFGQDRRDIPLPRQNQDMSGDRSPIGRKNGEKLVFLAEKDERSLCGKCVLIGSSVPAERSSLPEERRAAAMPITTDADPAAENRSIGKNAI